MKVLLAIPSHNRPYDIEKRVLYWLRNIDVDYKIFIEKDQEMYYVQTCGVENLVLTPNGSGLMGQVVEIGKYAKNNKYDLVLKMDDDMRFTKDKNKKPDTFKVINKYISDAVNKFQSDNVGMITVSKPMEYRYSDKKGFVIRKKPVYGNYFVRTEYLLRLKPELLLFDDLWISIEVKQDNKQTLTYIGAYEDAITHKNGGGLQTYDRDLLGRQSYEQAKKVYPKIQELKNSKHKKFDICVKNYF